MMIFPFAFLSILSAVCILGSADAYTNPIRNPDGADPFLTYFDGWYYLLTTTQVNVQIARSETLDGLKQAEPQLLYTDTDPSRCCNVWAPELAFLGGSWYLYYTAGVDGDLSKQNAHALKGGATPWDPFTYAAQLTTDWNIDGTILSLPDLGNYFVSSCMTGIPKQGICVRVLNDDFISLGDQLAVISQPDQPWEEVMDAVNEGPSALYFGSRTYLAYSASQCASNGYCVATLEWSGGDPMDPASWTKSPGCVFASANGNYGTGHNSFFKSPDGQTTYITFHATSVATGSCGGDRYAMVQPLTANDDGTPNFGEAAEWSYVWPDPS